MLLSCRARGDFRKTTVFFSIMGKAKKLKVSKQNTVTTGGHSFATPKTTHSIYINIRFYLTQWVHLETRLSEGRRQLLPVGTKIEQGWMKMR